MEKCEVSRRVALDWKRLLGFDQADCHNRFSERLSAKVGNKPTLSPSSTHDPIWLKPNLGSGLID
jgi:hypothetical protein